MLHALAFIAGGIVDASPVPAFRHVTVRRGWISSCNGFVTYAAPFPLDLDFVVPGALFTAAIKACKEAPRFTLSTDRGRLTIESGALSVQLDCLTETIPTPYPQGFRVDTPEDIRPAFRRVLPYISTDTSKRWACSARLSPGRLMATNNVTLLEVEAPIRVSGEATIPRAFVEAVLKVKAAPAAILIAQASVTVGYPSGAWIMGKTYPDQWPQIEKFLPVAPTAAPLPAGFFDALDTLASLSSGSDDLVIDCGHVTMLKTNGAAASVQLPGLPASASRWSLGQLRSLRGIASHVDLAAYPAPACFFGEGVRGAIAGKG